jgi:hypothetical protein
VYAPVAHNHSGVYSVVGHNHDGVYALLVHDHDDVYALIDHDHAAGDLTSGTLIDARVAASNVTQHVGALNHNSLLNYSANQHVDHTAVSISAGAGLTGGGTLAATRTLALDIPGLSAITEVVAGNDYIVVYSASASAHRKVLLSNLGFSGGGGSTNADDIDSGTLDSTYGGLSVNASAFTGMIRMVSGVASVATAGVDYDIGAHTQNTDTGTTNAYFQLLSGSSGGRVYWDSGAGEFRLRNAANSAYANLRIGDLYIEGSVTEIASNQVNIGDNLILLNSDNVLNSTNSDGGFAVKLLAADDTTRRDASFQYNASTYRWEATGFEATTSAPTTKPLAAVHTELIGNNSDTTFVVTHGLKTTAVVVSVILVSTGEHAYVTCYSTDEDDVTVEFATTIVPTTNQYRVVVIG